MGFRGKRRYYPKSKRKCIKCKKDYLPTSGSQKYCLDCSYDYKKYLNNIHREKKCLTCKKFYIPINSKQKYCSIDCSPYRCKKRKRFLQAHFYDCDKYSPEIVLENVQRYFKNQPLTIPLRIFIKNPLVKNILYNAPTQKREAQRLAKKYVQIPQGYLCDICNNNLAIDRHHEDYAQPLLVYFLCRSCHTKLHHGSAILPKYS